jgi:hypothetical protein
MACNSFLLSLSLSTPRLFVLAFDSLYLGDKHYGGRELSKNHLHPLHLSVRPILLWRAGNILVDRQGKFSRWTINRIRHFIYVVAIIFGALLSLLDLAPHRLFELEGDKFLSYFKAALCYSRSNSPPAEFTTSLFEIPNRRINDSRRAINFFFRYRYRNVIVAQGYQPAFIYLRSSG